MYPPTILALLLHSFSDFTTKNLHLAVTSTIWYRLVAGLNAQLRLVRRDQLNSPFLNNVSISKSLNPYAPFPSFSKEKERKRKESRREKKIKERKINLSFVFLSRRKVKGKFKHFVLSLQIRPNRKES